MLQQIDRANLQNLLLQEEVILVDFYADWCGPCQSLLPTLEKVSQDFTGRATIAKINVDKNPELSAEYGVRSIPALFYFKKGKLAGKQSGLQSETMITQTLDNLLAN
ncbi:MAG: thioredoxin [Saprospiraceae bacterium]